MQSVLYEARKQRAFKEAWVGFIIAGILMLVFLSQTLGLRAEDRAMNWYLVQQDIYTYGATLTAFLIVIGLPRLICYERERGTDSLICASNKGRFITWKAKVLYCLAYCAFVVFAIGVFSLLVHCGSFAFEGARDPVSRCVYFSSEALPPMSNIEYCILQYVFLFLGSLYFAGFILIVAALTKRTVATVIIGAIVYFTCMIYEYAHSMFEGVINVVLAFAFRFGFGGYLFQESYSSLWDIGMPGAWTNVRKSTIYEIIVIIAEFVVLWLLWRRKDRA